MRLPTRRLELGAVGPPPQEDRPENFFNQSLLERAGLDRRKVQDEENRYQLPDELE